MLSRDRRGCLDDTNACRQVKDWMSKNQALVELNEEEEEGDDDEEEEGGDDEEEGDDEKRGCNGHLSATRETGSELEV